MILDLRVRARKGDRDGLGRWQAAKRALGGTTIDIGVYSCACIALLAGRFMLSFLLWLVAIAVLVVDAALLAGSSRRSLADRIAATVVVRAGLYRKSWETARENEVMARGIMHAQNGFGHMQGVTQRMGDPEQLRQLREIGQDVGRRTASTARQAVASERGQQAQRVAKSAGANLKRAYDRRHGSGNRSV
ncbi:hypothetical protein OG225_08040 [Nocardia sp. NBC_01377]|uniref:hypothetical protein n=1 Tax=Nocardia sp. NBC_01377 TaxID=2903595 RepID=UPI003256070B